MKSEWEPLAELLKERLRVIGDHDLRESNPEEQLAQLKSVSEKITAYQQAKEEELPGRLKHFLTQCSFDKALAFIEAS